MRALSGRKWDLLLLISRMLNQVKLLFLKIHEIRKSCTSERLWFDCYWYRFALQTSLIWNVLLKFRHGKIIRFCTVFSLRLGYFHSISQLDAIPCSWRWITYIKSKTEDFILTYQYCFNCILFTVDIIKGFRLRFGSLQLNFCNCCWGNNIRSVVHIAMTRLLELRLQIATWRSYRN
jgi:hypothetical protein